MGELSKHDIISKLKIFPSNLKVNFDNIPEIEISAKEIFRCDLSGTFKSYHRIKHGNIVQCSMDNLSSKDASFNYVDFKDSSIKNSQFNKTSFDYGAIINSNIEDTTFNKCHFHNLSITGTIFNRTSFINCNLSNMVIETCKFFNCEFNNCTTSNKLFEYCLFEKSNFKQTDLQLQSIIDNFGITQDNLEKVKIRNKSVDEDYEFLLFDNLSEYSSFNFSDFDIFKIEYFKNPKILSLGSNSLDKLYDLETWLSVCKIPITFTNLLNLFYEFLLEKYESDDSTLVPVIKLHTLTSELTERFEFKNDLYNIVMGVHMGLSRFVERFLHVVLNKVKNSSKPLHLLVDGPNNKSYYYHNLNFVFEGSTLRIANIKKFNSPNELQIIWENFSDLLPLISVFVATRFNIEFKKLLRREEYNQQNKDKKTNKDNNKSMIKYNALEQFKLNVGLDEKDKHLYGIKLKTIFPGSLLMDIRLQVSTKLLGKAKSVLLAILEKDNSVNKA